jgi:hypothetical protein
MVTVEWVCQGVVAWLVCMCCFTTDFGQAGTRRHTLRFQRVGRILVYFVTGSGWHSCVVPCWLWCVALGVSIIVIVLLLWGDLGQPGTTLHGKWTVCVGPGMYEAVPLSWEGTSVTRALSTLPCPLYICHGNLQCVA